VVGARLFQHGYDVTLVARGPHADVIRERGLRFEAPEGTEMLPIPVVGPSSLDVADPVVALLAVKSQDTAAAVRALADTGAVEAGAAEISAAGDAGAADVEADADATTPTATPPTTEVSR